MREYRCAKHRDRNPCAIEGCKRTMSAEGHFSNDVVLCSEHFRRFCPPHSKLRRIYRRFFRLAKRQATPANPEGWDRDLDRRFWRFWRSLIAKARRQAAGGDVDMTEINKMFGWTND